MAVDHHAAVFPCGVEILPGPTLQLGVNDADMVVELRVGGFLAHHHRAGGVCIEHQLEGRNAAPAQLTRRQLGDDVVILLAPNRGHLQSVFLDRAVGVERGIHIANVGFLVEILYQILSVLETGIGHQIGHGCGGVTKTLS